jgi:hypothetical protein
MYQPGSAALFAVPHGLLDALSRPGHPVDPGDERPGARAPIMASGTYLTDPAVLRRQEAGPAADRNRLERRSPGRAAKAEREMMTRWTRM